MNKEYKSYSWIWEVTAGTMLAIIAVAAVSCSVYTGVKMARAEPPQLLASTPREYRVVDVHRGKTVTVDIVEVGTGYRFNGLTPSSSCSRIIPIGSVRVLVEDMYQGYNSPYAVIAGLRTLCER